MTDNHNYVFTITDRGRLGYGIYFGPRWLGTADRDGTIHLWECGEPYRAGAEKAVNTKLSPNRPH